MTSRSPSENEMWKHVEERDKTPKVGRHRCRMDPVAFGFGAMRDAWELARPFGYATPGQPMLWAEDDQVLVYRFYTDYHLHIDRTENPFIWTYEEAIQRAEEDPSQ